MNPFTHPKDNSADETPHEFVVKKSLSELGQSKTPIERLRQFDYIEFGDETRLTNVMIMESMLTKFQALLGQECKLILVKGKNVNNAKDGFEHIHFLAGFESADKAYAVDTKIIGSIQSMSNKLILFYRLSMAMCLFFAVMSVPLILMVVGLFMLPLTIAGFFMLRKQVKKLKYNKQLFEKLCQVADAIPNANRYSI